MTALTPHIRVLRAEAEQLAARAAEYEALGATVERTTLVIILREQATAKRDAADQLEAEEPKSPLEEPRRSAGPFTAGKCQVYTEEPGVYDGAAVFDSTGDPFCLIADDLAIGGRSGALARATRIAENLNRTEGKP